MSFLAHLLQPKQAESLLQGRICRGIQWLYRFIEGTGAIAWFLAVGLSLVLVVFRKLPAFHLTIVLVFIITTVLASIVVVEVNRRKRLNLHHRWQALAWTHYRPVLADALIKSATKTGDSRFDFMTFYGGHFERLLTGGFYSEMQYTRGCTRHLDFVIFDIEYLEDLRVGVPFEGEKSNYKLVPLEKFLRERELGITLTVPPQFQHALRPLSHTTYAIPLRWGFNGVALKLSAASDEMLKRKGISIDDNTKFDLQWITDESSPFYQWLCDPNEPCWVVALDWYLPTMMLIAWDQYPAMCHALFEPHLNIIIERMKKLLPLMHPQNPLVLDPLRLAQRVHEEENLIVLGGGNWLKLIESHESDTLKLLPISSGYLLWCECMGFLGPDGEPADFKWALDANELVKWFAGKRHDVLSCSSFHAFSPTDMNEYQKITRAGQRSLVRQLPPVRSPDGYCIARNRWEEEWQKWRTELFSRSSTGLVNQGLSK